MVPFQHLLYPEWSITRFSQLSEAFILAKDNYRDILTPDLVFVSACTAGISYIIIIIHVYCRKKSHPVISRNGEKHSLNLSNIISNIDVSEKKATVFPGTPLAERMRQPFTIEYDADIDLRELDLSIVITPFLLNVIPLLWFLGGTYKVDSMDEDLFSSLELVRNGFRILYPNIPWKGQLIPETLISVPRRKNNTDLSQVLFFSGGVDSTYSALNVDPGKTVLLTIRGHDIALNNDKAWKTVCSQVNDFASTFNFRTARASANVFGLLRCGDIHKEHPELKPWYGMVQHGSGLAGLAFPLSVYHGWERIIFSSSIDEKTTHVSWGSHPFLEPRLKANGIKVISEGNELLWADKVLGIVDFYRNNPEMNKPFIRTCLDDMNGNPVKNCTLCEKCLRGIVSLMVRSEDPSEWGFSVESPLFGAVQNSLLYMTIPEFNIYEWDRIHALASRALTESRGEYRQFFNWFVNWYENQYII